MASSALGAPVDAQVSDSSGEAVRLSRFRGKPAILFYEDKDSTGLNQPLKDELFVRGKAQGLLGAASVVAVANLQAFNWFPARNFARAGVRDAEKKAGVPVLIDWEGALTRPPLALPAKSSTVLVLSPQGEVLFSHSGQLTPAQREEVFSLLKRLISA